MPKLKRVERNISRSTLKLIVSRVFLAVASSRFATPVFFYTRTRARSARLRVRVMAVTAILLLGFAGGFAATVSQPDLTAATTANTVNFQARLMTASGAIVPDGSYNVEFKLYNASSSSGSSQGSCTGDANCLWTETRTSGNTVSVANGYLTVNLGSVTNFPSNFNWGQQLWLTMRIGGSGAPSWDSEMSPRLLLTAVPAAYSLTQYNTSNTFSSSLTLQAPTGGNQTFVIQDQTAAGSYNLCVQNSTACGFAPNSGSANYIQNQNSGAQSTSNFWISGTGTMNLVQAATLDTPSGTTTLNIGTNNATAGINLNQNTAIAAGKSLTVTNGSVFFQKGTDYATTGVTNNVNFGSGALFRLAGASAQTITGIAGGTDGRKIVLINAAAQSATISNNNTNSTAGNRITTGTGADLTLASGASISLVYDSGASLWRVVGGSGGGSGVTTVGAFSGVSIANGASISGSTITFGPADGTNPGMVSTGAQTFAGNKTFTGTLTVSPAASTTALVVTNSNGNALVFDSTTNTFKVFENVASPTNYASISYASGAAKFAASSGTTQIGSGTGNVTSNLTGQNDTFQFSKTYSPTAAYSLQDYQITRTLSSGANAQSGAILQVKDTSSANAGISIAPTLLLLNQASTGGTIAGNLIDAQLAGVSKFKVDTTGAVTATSFSGNGSALTSLNGSNISSGTVGNSFLTNSGALTVTAGNGLTGGGSVALGGTTTLTVGAGTGITVGATTVGIANTTVTAASYGSASSVATFTVNAQGQLTTAASTSIAIAGSQITSGSVGATVGGTGQTAVTTGDLLYGSAANAWSRLADVATGNVLISGGVGVAPSWGKVGLTTHVSGTLPIANGGTNATSFAATNGAVYYNGTSLVATAASTGANQCLITASSGGAPSWATCPVGSTTLQAAYAAGVGGTTPSIAVSTTKSALSIQDSATNTITGNLLEVRSAAVNDSTLGTVQFAVTNAGNVSYLGQLTGGSSGQFVVNSSGNVTTAGTQISVNGSNPAVTLGASNTTQLAMASSGGAYSTSAVANDLVLRNTAASGNLIFQQGAGAAQLFIQGSTGNIGIGNASPHATLQVGAAIAATAFSSIFQADSGSLGTTAANELNLGTFGATVDSNSVGLGAHLYRTTTGSGGWTQSSLLLGMDVDATTRAGGAFIAIGSNGNIGIKNVNPQYTLDVTGNINATGNITAVTETLSGNLNVQASTGSVVINSGTASCSTCSTRTTVGVLNADSFHTNGIGQGQIFIGGEYANSNGTMQLNSNSSPFSHGLGTGFGVNIDNNLTVGANSIQPTAVATNGTAASTVLAVTGGKGGNTTGTTGQIGGTGGAITLTGGTGGDASTGSTNGTGGTITLQGGSPGAGTGTTGAYGAIALQTSGGNVGIGTASPGWKLTVQAASGSLGLFQSTGANSAYLAIDNAAGGQQSTIDLEDAGVIKFQIGKQTSNSFFMYDTVQGRDFLDETTGGNVALQANGGNVGIGTASPAALLSIANGANDPTNYGRALQITNANGNSQQIAFIRNGNNVMSLGYKGASSIWGFGTGQVTDSSFDPSTLSMDMSTGRVGIGTSAPVAQLTNTTLNPVDVFGNGVSGAALDWYNSSGTAGYVASFGNAYNAAVGNGVLIGTTNTSSSSRILELESGSTSRLLVRGDGNVGIGNSSPSWMLDVNGDINATGWVRQTGSNGFYWQSWGGGWYMSDSSWIRGYNDKGIYTGGQVQGGSLQSNGTLYFAQANPTISASSYFIAPGGAYFNSGTVYAEAAIQARGGVHDDTHTNLTLSGGTSGNTTVSGNIQVNGAGTISGGQLSLNASSNTLYLSSSSSGGYITGPSAFPHRLAMSTDNDSSWLLTLDTSGATRFVIVGDPTNTSDLRIYGPSGTCTMNGTLTCASDARLKTNIQSYSADTSLQGIMALKAVSFNWNNPNWDQSTQYGFIAQDMQQVFPQFVTTVDNDGHLGISYEKLVVPLVGAVQQQQQEIMGINNQLDGFGNILNNGDIKAQTLDVVGSAHFAADVNVDGNLAVKGLTTVEDIKVNGHIITGGQTPDIQILTAAGSSNASVSIDGNDTSGTITVTSGDPTAPAHGSVPAITGPSAGDMATITFKKPYGKTPRILITPADGKSAPMLVYPTSMTANSFTISLSNIPAANTIYTFNYFIVQ